MNKPERSPIKRPKQTRTGKPRSKAGQALTEQTKTGKPRSKAGQALTNRTVRSSNSPQTETSGEPRKAAFGDLLKERYTRVLDGWIQEMDEGTLKSALAAPTDAGTLARLLSATISTSEAIRSLDPLASAIMRGAELKRQILEEAGGTLATIQVATLLGITRQSVQQRARRGTLLAIDTPSSELIFPAIQFTESGTIPGLEKVLQAFRMQSPWTRLSVLLDTDEAIGGERVIDALNQGRLEEVLEIVRAFGV